MDRIWNGLFAWGIPFLRNIRAFADLEIDYQG